MKHIKCIGMLVCGKEKMKWEVGFKWNKYMKQKRMGKVNIVASFTKRH